MFTRKNEGIAISGRGFHIVHGPRGLVVAEYDRRVDILATGKEFFIIRTYIIETLEENLKRIPRLKIGRTNGGFVIEASDYVGKDGDLRVKLAATVCEQVLRDLEKFGKNAFLNSERSRRIAESYEQLRTAGTTSRQT